ncbi:bile acid:sodium symporter [Escherichia coli]|nr:bile acid:sodium symporter [Escherichia coli]
MKRLLLAVVTMHLWVMCCTVSDSGRAVCLVETGKCRPDALLRFLYLCILPATVQSAIAFTSMAGGNVAAAVCSSASSLLGIFLSPLLVGLVMNVHGAGGSLEQVGKSMLQLLPYRLCWGIFPGRGLVTGVAQ